MKTHFIIKSIRKVILLQLSYPVLLILLFTEVLFSAPMDNFFNPRPLNYKSSYESFYNPTLPHVTASVPSLEYSGLDYVVNGRTKGHYYYSIENGSCQFYILSSKANTLPNQRLQQMKLRGRLVRLDDIEYDLLIKNMASKLNWSTDSLKTVSAPYSVSTIIYPFYLNYLFYITLCGGLVIALADMLYLAYLFMEPLRTPAFRYLGPQKSKKQLFSKVEAELRHTGTKKYGDIFLTSSYFICTCRNNTILLPLNLLTQIYYKTGKIRLGKKYCPTSYTLCVTVSDGKILEFSGYTKEVIDKILFDLKQFGRPDSRILEQAQN